MQHNPHAGGRHSAPRHQKSSSDKKILQQHPRIRWFLQRLWWGLRLIFATLAVCPVFLFVVWFNYTVDCSGLYQGDLVYRNIAELLLQENNVSGFSMMDHRAVAERYIQLLPVEQVHDTVTIGSSRVMQLTKELIGTSFFNYGVTGGDYRDVMNHFYMLDKYGKLPKRVVLGVDPWLFRADALDKRSNAELFEEMQAEALGHKTGYVAPQPSKAYLKADELVQKLTDGTYNLTNLNITTETLPALLDLAYFQGNLDYWWENRDAEAVSSEVTDTGYVVEYRAVTDEELVDNDGEIKMGDGSVWYAAHFRNASQEAVTSQAHTHAGTFVYMEGYTELEQAQCELFEQFVAYMQSCGVEVIFYLSPYHPFTYEYQQLYKQEVVGGFFEVEPYLRDYAAQQGITVVGSYDPTKLGLTGEDFYDGLHVRTSGIAKFFGGFDAAGNLLPGSQWDGVALTELE